MENLSEDILIGIEPVNDYKIEEILYDGTEIYKKPLSFNEYINELSEKIDFEENSGNAENEAKSEKHILSKNSIIEPSLIKLRNALMEINVLLDVLKITKQQQYLALDFIANDNPDNKPAYVLLGKKKTLSKAASILLNGAETIKTTLSNPLLSPITTVQKNFHLELLNLRQIWRLKKVGEKILGDISYKSVGSQFNENGNFEVSKNSKIDSSSTLKIILPQQLKNEAYIKISIHRDGKIYSSSNKLNASSLRSYSQVHNYLLNKKLEEAQNSLFCKEILFTLVKEALEDETSFLPHNVIGNTITLTLFPDVHLIVSLEYIDSDDLITRKDPHMEELPNVLEEKLETSEIPKSLYDYMDLIGLSLHHSLCLQHRRFIRIDPPNPVCASLHDNFRKRLSGPLALRTDEFQTFCNDSYQDFDNFPCPTTNYNIDEIEECLDKEVSNTMQQTTLIDSHLNSNNPNQDQNLNIPTKSTTGHSLLEDYLGQNLIDDELSSTMPSTPPTNKEPTFNKGKSLKCFEEELLAEKAKFESMEPLFASEVKWLKLRKVVAHGKLMKTKLLKPLLDLARHIHLRDQ
ncbi:unnamed protein product [Gordionus sp. m RMFG-2023]